MIARLVVRSLARGKARFICAVAGVAIAVGSLVFMTSLVATNNAQAPDAARKACVPWAAWQVRGIKVGFGRRMPPPPGTKPGEQAPGAAKRPMPPPEGMGRRPEGAPMRRPEGPGMRPEGGPGRPRGPRADLELEAMMLMVDYRPGGHVLQGPPMMAFMARAPQENPYGAVKLTQGRWVDESSAELEIVCVKTSMRRFGAAAPELGSSLKFVGRKGTMTAKIVGYLEGGKLPPQFPYVFANAKAFEVLAGEEKGTVAFFKSVPPARGPVEILTAETPSVVSSFKADEQKRMDFATPLLLVAAFLTALSLLVNSLLLSVESNRATLATLRTLGLTRGGTVGFVFVEALLSGCVGWLLGVAGAIGALACWVNCQAALFPAGMAVAWPRVGLTLVVLPFIMLLAVVFALRPALKVRPMDAAAHRPRPHAKGMVITFACGFAAFVAVEVWGASLMRAFVPSPEWPDAIVSILPTGVSSFDVEKLQGVEGVKRISELVPRQCFVAGRKKPSNALFLAAEWLPKFNFLRGEGTWEEAEKAVREGKGVVITEMMMNAYGLHKGDVLKVELAGRRGPAEIAEFQIAGVVDLNWHMVTSRGLVRGMNGSPGMTDGPVFCSFDTIAQIDPRTSIVEPAMSAAMTHLWVEYEEDFLKKHGVFPAGRLIEREIAKRLGNPTDSTVRLHARDEIADGTLAHGSDIIGQAARVPFVFLAILAIGFVAMLVAEADSRKREFAVLRAVGATRGQIVRRLANSALKTALYGIVWGLATGSLVGWLFTFKTGNWPGLPHWFVLPVEVVAEGALGAVLFALIFALPTALCLVGKRR